MLFDLDGTLVDSAPDLTRAIDHMLIALARPVAGLKAVEAWVGNGTQALVQRALTGRSDGDRIDPVTEQDFTRAYRLFEAFYAQSLMAPPHRQHRSQPSPPADRRHGLYPGVLETLACLSTLEGLKLGLITNKPRRFTRPLLQATGLEGYFGVIVCGDDLAEKKPHPLPLQHALKQLGCVPNEALMIGDSISDIKSAQAAGMASIGVTYGYNHGVPLQDLAQADSADLLIDRLAMLWAQ